MVSAHAWNVRIDIAAEFTEDMGSALRDRLTEHQPTVTVATVAGVATSDRTTIRLTLTASTVAEAQDAATSAVRSALTEIGRQIELVRMETLPAEDYAAETRAAKPDIGGTGEIAELLGVSRTRVDQLVKRPGFPAPLVRLGPAGVWDLGQVRAWEKTWDRRTGRPRARFRGPTAPEAEA